MQLIRRLRLIACIHGAIVLLSASLTSCHKSEESARTSSYESSEHWVEVAPAIANTLASRRTEETSAFVSTSSPQSTQVTSQNVDCESIGSPIDKLRCRERLAASKTQNEDLATTQTTARMAKIATRIIFLA